MLVGLMALAVAMTIATAAAAQTPSITPDAPAAARPEFARDPQVRLWGYRSPRPEGMPKPLRSAVPDGDVVTWMPHTDPAVRGLIADPEARAHASLRLAIDPQGRVTGCTANPRLMRGDLPSFAYGLCERISARARFLPAIDEDGARVADTYQLTIGFDRYGRRASDPVPPLVVEREPSPVPMVARDEWPPRWTDAPPAFRDLRLAAGGAAAHTADTTPWAGIEVRQDRDGRVTQRIILSSGDVAFDREAHRIARGAGPIWPDPLEPRGRRVMIHFVSADGQPAAILPVSTRPTIPGMTEAERQGLAALVSWPGASAAARARLRLALDIDADGRVSQCRIEQSSGSDAGDVAACRAMRTAHFEPRRDIFGWPHPWFLFDWPLVVPPS